MKLEFTAREANAARRVMAMAGYHSIEISPFEIPDQITAPVDPAADAAPIAAMIDAPNEGGQSNEETASE